MKTRNILLSMTVFAMLAAPMFALDYHEQKIEIGKTIKASSPQKELSHQKYLNMGLLRLQINNEAPVDFDNLRTATKNTIADGKISNLEQYHFMLSCIANNRNDILRVLLEGGFNPEADVPIGMTPLPAMAVDYDNEEAFDLTFKNSQERLSQILEELRDDTSLLDRLISFLGKYEDNTSK